MHASIVVLFALVAVAASQQQFQQQFARAPIPILQHELNRDVNGHQFSLAFATGNGISHTDRGVLKPGPEGHVLTRQGETRYTSPEGQVITLRFEADENGYRAVGDHLPKAPIIEA